MKINKFKRNGLPILKTLLMTLVIIANIFLLISNSRINAQLELIEHKQNNKAVQSKAINWNPGVFVHMLAPNDTIFVKPFSATKIAIPNITPTGIKTSTWCALIQDKFHKNFEDGYFEISLSIGAYKNLTTEYIIITFSDGSTSKYFVRYNPEIKRTEFSKRHPIAYQIG